MPIVTLTSDWGLKDPAVAIVKGKLYTQMPTAAIVDITHLVPHNDIMQAAYILRRAYISFPPGTIHIVDVSYEDKSEQHHICVHANGHFFIGPDSGIFSMVLDDEFQAAAIIGDKSIVTTFASSDFYIDVVKDLHAGKKVEQLGTPLKELNKKVLIKAIVEGNVIRGNIIYIDNYGNANTNISKTMFDEVGRGRPFVIRQKKSDYDIDSLKQRYTDVPPGEKLAIINNDGYLQIAMNNTTAAGLLGLKIIEYIRVEFYDSANSKNGLSA